MKMTIVFILAFSLIRYQSSDTIAKRVTFEDSKYSIKDGLDILKFDSVLHTGWYFISEIQTGYKRKEIKSGKSFDINPVPIITVENFQKSTLLHEKDCWAIIIQLDMIGAQSLYAGMQKTKGKQIAFILDDKLVRIQAADDPQFAHLNPDTDPRLYGQVLTFPCNSFSSEELKNYSRILNREI
ncbi:MAG TPA: hypothetical protein VHK91_09565 [Flavisolibacter sp.]|jgi:hypothetical protein|nr:hypothetical protein [Flavisolibacter sp.]